jgi:MoxR-like ATPase
MFIDQVAKILDNFTAIDVMGDDITLKIPITARRRAYNNGCALKLVMGKTGISHWKDISLDEYSTARNEAMAFKKVDKTSNITENNVIEFVKNSMSLKPSHLFIPDLKWKYLIRSVLRGKNIMMTGPSGCGKTLSVQTVAGVLNKREFFYFNMGATQDPRSTLIGNTHYNKERGTFVAEALFIKAIQTPNAIILLDELTRGHSDAWNILMTVLDDNQRYLRIDEMPDTPTIRVAAGVTFIATANIGAEYTATRVLDRAMLDRFSAVIEMEPLNMEDELALLKLTYPEVSHTALTAVAEVAAHTRMQVRSEEPRVTTLISSRMTVEMAGLLNDGFTLADAAEACVYPFFSPAGGNDSERTYMRQLVQKYFVDPTNTKQTPFDPVVTNMNAMPI